MSPASLDFFFFNDPAPPEISTFPLHAALPISCSSAVRRHETFTPPLSTKRPVGCPGDSARGFSGPAAQDRKSTRLNSSHANISYAVFCLKKKTKNEANIKYARNNDQRALQELA